MPRSKFAPKGADGKAKPRKRNFSKLPQFWSYSRFEDFYLCPYRYALKHVAKVALPKQDNKAFERGNMLHLKSQHYIDGDIKTVPKELLTFAGEYKAVRELGAVAEIDYTVDVKWQPAEPDDFENAWLRAKLDIVIASDTLTVVDGKSGRMREDKHRMQGEIYGILALERHQDEYDAVDVEFWYWDSGDTLALAFDMKEVKELKREWLKRIKPMLKGRLFPKTPSQDACAYCPFRSDKVLGNGEQGECDRWREVTN